MDGKTWTKEEKSIGHGQKETNEWTQCPTNQSIGNFQWEYQRKGPKIRNVIKLLYLDYWKRTEKEELNLEKFQDKD